MKTQREPQAKISLQQSLDYHVYLCLNAVEHMMTMQPDCVEAELELCRIVKRACWKRMPDRLKTAMTVTKACDEAYYMLLEAGFLSLGQNNKNTKTAEK